MALGPLYGGRTFRNSLKLVGVTGFEPATSTCWRWLKTQQVRLNTLVNIEPAEPLFDGQFSTSANNPRAMDLAKKLG